jgi:mRNA-degrading endonuclease YafQ of YafQ-DinJ toxin-antitoxin module
MEVVNLLAGDTPLPRRNFDHHWPKNGAITATATSGRISFSSTASPDDDRLELARLGSHGELGL